MNSCICDLLLNDLRRITNYRKTVPHNETLHSPIFNWWWTCYLPRKGQHTNITLPWANTAVWVYERLSAGTDCSLHQNYPQFSLPCGICVIQSLYSSWPFWMFDFSHPQLVTTFKSLLTGYWTECQTWSIGWWWLTGIPVLPLDRMPYGSAYQFHGVLVSIL